MPAEGLAFYKGEYAPGAYAPRGWHCRVWYGSSGGFILVTPEPIDTTDFLPPKTPGAALEIEQSIGGTSGRFSVAKYATRLFPKRLGNFIERVKNEHLIPDSEFASRRYARDSVVYLDSLVAEFTTAPAVNGLGTAGTLAPSEDPIHGIAIVTADSIEPDMTILVVRLNSAGRHLESAILRLNKTCLRNADHC